LNFGRFQGGVDFTLCPGTHLYVSGGHDVADSDAPIIEGDFSSWLMLHSEHPINGSFSSIYDWQNGVESSEIDVEAILLSTEKYMILGGIGGALAALSLGHIDPDFAFWTTSGEFVFLAILSGYASVTAVFVAAVLLELVRSFSSQYFPNTWQGALGIFLLLVILFLPEGLGSLVRRRRRTAVKPAPKPVESVK